MLRDPQKSSRDPMQLSSSRDIMLSFLHKSRRDRIYTNIHNLDEITHQI